MGKFPSLNECDPGFDPVEYNVVILPQQVENKTAGGIILVEKTTDADKFAQIKGLLVAASPLAFNFDNWPTDAAYDPPKAGDLVYFGKYATRVPITGPDGREYWMMKDKEVAAIIREPNETAAQAA